MKVIIISDSHGNIANLKNVLGFSQKIKADAIIHCGDWTDIRAVETVLESKIPLYSVLGNGDISEEMKNKFEEFKEIEIDGVRIGVVHGPREIKEHLLNKKFDIIFYGHIHSQDESEINDVRVVRPGALENGINFAVFDTKTKTVEFIHD
jgi:uncharacterized protein